MTTKTKVIIGVSILALAVGTYFGLDYYKKQKAQKEAEKKAAEEAEKKKINVNPIDDGGFVGGNTYSTSGGKFAENLVIQSKSTTGIYKAVGNTITGYKIGALVKNTDKDILLGTLFGNSKSTYDDANTGKTIMLKYIDKLGNQYFVSAPTVKVKN